jgi:hypothetical protein
VGDSIYQPVWRRQIDDTYIVEANKGDPIAKVLKIPGLADYPYHYADESEDDAEPYFVDGGAAKLNVSISSWCRTDCSTSFLAEIRGLNLNGKSVIDDVGRAEEQETVYKVGRTSGRTVGRVTGINETFDDGTGALFHNAIFIEATQDDCDGERRFSTLGDSGSALIADRNGKNVLVGIVFGHNSSVPSMSSACHIHPAMSILQVTPITATQPAPPRVTRLDIQQVATGGPSQLAALRARFYSSEQGRRIASVVEAHQAEVAHLINHVRNVTVVWHRNKGPAFLACAAQNARRPEARIPREIDGTTLEMLLVNLRRALQEHGSPSLCTAIDENFHVLVTFVQGFDSVHDMVAAIVEKERV